MNFKKFLKHPFKSICSYLLYNNFFNFMKDSTFLKFRFKYETKKKLNLENPTTFNEKLQWLKLYYRKPEFTTMVDKYEVKSFLEDKIGKEHIIPSLGVYKNYNDIPFDALPNQFVIKCTHNSGGIIICKDKTKFDPKLYKKNINKTLSRNYFYSGREWPYKNIKPRVLVEKYMKDEGFDILPVYKIFNFNGEPKLIQLILNDKSKEETVDYYDIKWNKLDLKQNFKNSTIVLPKPKKLDEILSLAKKLSQNLPFIRTDFYIINDCVYFSEFTFFSDNGFKNFTPEKWDAILGSWIELPEKTISIK